MAPYLERTMRSILDQHYPNLEYIVIDGGSTDGSVDIIKKYSDQLSFWVSEPDQGMYHAIQKGFEKSTGEIMAWLNADDLYFPNALHVVGRIFRDTGVNWIQGKAAIANKEDQVVYVENLKRWSKYDFYEGRYQFIQQESTFWTRKLWQDAGASLDVSMKYAGDFELWLRFFRHAELHSVRTVLGCFRMRDGEQLSSQHYEKYLAECEAKLAEELQVLPADVKHNLNLLKAPKTGGRIASLKNKIRPKEEFSIVHPKYIMYNRPEDRFKLHG